MAEKDINKDKLANIARLFSSNILTQVKGYVKYENSHGFVEDPFMKVTRCRVNAEICKSLIAVDYSNNQDVIKKIIAWLISEQNIDGSWNEEHRYYDKPSALITSIVGELFVLFLKVEKDPAVENSVKKAKDYVISQNFYPGYFKKSQENYTDCLNVNATCGAFLAEYGQYFKDEPSIKAARAAAFRVSYYQFPDGSFPYTTTERGYPYKYHFYIPCIHYQGVTLYYLSKINKILNETWLKDTIIRGAEWLSRSQKPNGKFDWSKSGLMFAYYLSGAYAFAYASFCYAAQWDIKYLDNAYLCLDQLEKNHKGIMLRWEHSSWATIFPSIFVTLKTANIGQYPFRHKLFRFGYGMYRQIALRRFSESIDEKTFNILLKVLPIKASTIEPSANYLDLFMTSEILDCLSSTLAAHS